MKWRKRHWLLMTCGKEPGGSENTVSSSDQPDCTDAHRAASSLHCSTAPKTEDSFGSRRISVSFGVFSNLNPSWFKRCTYASPIDPPPTQSSSTPMRLRYRSSGVSLSITLSIAAVRRSWSINEISAVHSQRNGLPLVSYSIYASSMLASPTRFG